MAAATKEHMLVTNPGGSTTEHFEVPVADDALVPLVAPWPAGMAW